MTREKVAIDKELLVDMMNYISSKPFLEVEGLVARVRNEKFPKVEEPVEDTVAEPVQK